MTALGDRLRSVSACLVPTQDTLARIHWPEYTGQDTLAGIHACAGFRPSSAPPGGGPTPVPLPHGDACKAGVGPSRPLSEAPALSASCGGQTYPLCTGLSAPQSSRVCPSLWTAIPRVSNNKDAASQPAWPARRVPAGKQHRLGAGRQHRLAQCATQSTGGPTRYGGTRRWVTMCCNRDKAARPAWPCYHVCYNKDKARMDAIIPCVCPAAPVPPGATASLRERQGLSVSDHLPSL